MLKYLLVVTCIAWLGSLFGCTRKPKVMTIEQLSYPVIRILDTSPEGERRLYAEIILDKEALSLIPVQDLWYVTNPLVIDSNANVLEMKDIKNEHGGLWAMINPTGQMPVTFTLLQRKETGIEIARDLIANFNFLRSDLDSNRSEIRRERIRRATKVDEIIQIIGEAPPRNPAKVEIDNPNEKGFARISIRDGNIFKEGIVDSNGNDVVQSSSSMIVDDIADSLALVRFKRKALFVRLDDGYVSSEDLDSIDGFQHAEPFSCGLAMVMVNDVRFYLDSKFEKAFDLDFNFAESFHQDRAYVKVGDQHRIIDTRGDTVADLDYDEVNLQSPFCWQVTKIEQEKYLSGFVDLNGKLIANLIYDSVGRYDPEVKRIRVSRNGLHGFLDEYAKVAIPVLYEYAEPFAKGKARVAVDGRIFFINTDGVEVPE